MTSTDYHTMIILQERERENSRGIYLGLEVFGFNPFKPEKYPTEGEKNFSGLNLFSPGTV